MLCASFRGPRSGPWPGSTHRDLLDGRMEERTSFLSSSLGPSSRRPGRTATTASPLHTRGYDRHTPISFKHHGEAHDPISQRREARLERSRSASLRSLPPSALPSPTAGHRGRRETASQRGRAAAERSFGPENKSGAPGARPLQGPLAESPRKAAKASSGLPGTQRGALCREDCHPVQHHQDGAIATLLPGTQTGTRTRSWGGHTHDTSGHGADAHRP